MALMRVAILEWRPSIPPRLALVCLLVAFTPVLAQEEAIDFDELLRSGERWLMENADEKTLAALGGLDAEALEKLCAEVKRELEGEYVLDLAAIASFAHALVPVLEKREETRPYAAWLRPRLDYFDVTRQLQPAVPPPQKPASNPSPERGRSAWQQQLADRLPPSQAEKYVPRLKSIFAAQRAPRELVWLAEVESGFNPRARSPAGAAGLFQLMPVTARSLGLRTFPWDERFDPDKNARAAARYLVYLRGRFRDWPLALAAYNAGEGRVRGLLTKHKAVSFDAIATRLPAETQLYVPKVAATIHRREGVALAKL